MLDDAAGSVWRGAEILGEKLSREEALRHRWKATAFEVLDEAFAQDRWLHGFLQRVRCGDAAVPLEMDFRAPDDIAALPAKDPRAELSRSFASLDGSRFFVRCLLPVPVEGYETWCVGLWIEVAKSDYDDVRAAWDDPVRYPTLRFSGLVANDVAATLDLPVPRGIRVALHTPDPASPPRVEAPATGELADLLAKPWPRAAFETYAVARAFL